MIVIHGFKKTGCVKLLTNIMSGWHCILNLHVYHSLEGVGTPRCMILFRNVTAPLTGKFESLIITLPINVITTSNIDEEEARSYDLQLQKPAKSCFISEK